VSRPLGVRSAGAALLLCPTVAAGASGASGAEQPSPRIVGGGKANAAGWRFAVAIEQKRRLICTGSLIAPTKVLTAAHCAKGGKRKRLSVFAGGPWISPRRRPPRIRVNAVAIERILAELEECELVCANCHRERTFGTKRKRAA
jgi:secreted trypsin-like serine protease